MKLQIPSGTFRAYLFDCDGTVVDSMPLHYIAWKQALGEWGATFDEELFYRWGGKPPKEIIADLNQMQGLHMPVEAVAERKENLYFSLLPQLKPVPEVVEHINAQYGRIPFAVVSGSNRESIVKSLTTVGLLDRFEVIVGHEDYTRSKPAPDAFLLGAERLGIAPKDCLAFEDTEMGIQSATAAGMASVRVPPPLERRNGTGPGSRTQLTSAIREETDLTSIDADEPFRKTPHWTGALTFLSVAAAVTLLHLLTNRGYGFHRDELQFLSDARHLDFGFVPYPPFTCALERLGLELFGLSPVGLRLFSVLAQSAVVILTGLMAREVGGGRLAQFIAMLAVAFSPVPLFQGTEFQYSSFDLLWWVLTAFFTLRLLRTLDPRWWLAIGGTIGIGLETKYTICFLAAGLLLGFLVSPSRNLLRSRWFACGIGLALLIFLPNLIWQARHGFITLHFLEYIHARDVRWGRGKDFWFKQFFVCSSIWAAPLWLAGIWLSLRHGRTRPLAAMYLFPALFFTLTHAVFYYLAPAYPMMTAMGAVGFCRWLATLRPLWGNTLAALELAGLLVGSIASIAMVIPFPSGWWFHDFGLNNNDALREEIGWDDLVRTVAGIRNALPADEQAHLGITTANYGEYGAIEILGRAYGLPEPIGTTNSEWLRGYPMPQPTTLIVLGLSAEEANSIFTGCRLAGHNGNSEGVRNEESQDHPDIFVCGPPREPWPELWMEHQDFG